MKSLNPPLYTMKQMGDACEMLVAGELSLAGVPALRVPDFWPGYDLIAQMPDRTVLKISVKGRTFKRGHSFVTFNSSDIFDWLAIVLLPGEDCIYRQFFILPRSVAIREMTFYPNTKEPPYYECQIDSVLRKFVAYKDNFSLSIVE
jgi:hypothetical protein